MCLLHFQISTQGAPSHVKQTLADVVTARAMKPAQVSVKRVKNFALRFSFYSDVHVHSSMHSMRADILVMNSWHRILVWCLAGQQCFAMLAVGCKAGIVWLWRYQLPGQYAPFGTASPDAFTLVWLPSNTAFHSSTRSVVVLYTSAYVKLYVASIMHAFVCTCFTLSMHI